MSRKLVEDTVRESIEQYFHDLKGVAPSAMHDMVIQTVEKPLFEIVLKHAGGNQSKAAEWLGLNRNTLRRKLKDHQLSK
jgi:Fis family transcriptional regulator, factor for inversion stimulation protein